MTLQQLDGILKSWKERLSTIAENLLALQSDTTYQSLTGTGGLEEVKPTGATAARVSAALRTMNELFVRFGLLQATVERADKLREGLPSFFGSEVRLRAIQELLLSRSIEMPVDGWPLAERGLLSGAPQAQRWTPEELLDTMSHTFAQVRDAIAEVGKAWHEAGVLAEQAGAELARLQGQTVTPSHLLKPWLEEAENQLSRVREQAHNDPLGALASLKTRMEPAMAEVRQRLRVAEQVHQQWRRAQARWNAVETLHTDALAKSSQLELQIQPVASEVQIVAETLVRSLREWLNRLDRKRDEGAFDAVAVGLRNWMAAAEKVVAQDEALITRYNAQLASKGELRGRLDALRAKARARGLTNNVELTGLQGSAEALLHTKPVNLERAAEAVARFENGLLAARVQPGVRSA